MEAFDNEYEQYQSDLSKESSCLECGECIEEEKQFCSKECFKANQI